MQTEKYIHHGKKVSVQKMLKGKHRYHCLCFGCKKFLYSKDANGKRIIFPADRNKNCPIANMVYALCVLQNLCLPVWECPSFVPKGDMT